MDQAFDKKALARSGRTAHYQTKRFNRTWVVSVLDQSQHDKVECKPLFLVHEREIYVGEIQDVVRSSWQLMKFFYKFEAMVWRIIVHHHRTQSLTLSQHNQDSAATGPSSQAAEHHCHQRDLESESSLSGLRRFAFSTSALTKFGQCLLSKKSVMI